MTMAERLHVNGAAEPTSLVCSLCGYGIARLTSPGPCPMCHAENAWVHSHWPSGRRIHAAERV